MIPPISTLHHVTATVAGHRADLRFYTGLLGLRLVKKTVNFDNHGVYHFYYGDERGSPSSLMTTFPYAGKGVPVGLKGAGQITVTSFSVPPGSLDYWRDRFTRTGLEYSQPRRRFEEEALMVEDPSGLNIELREGAGDSRSAWLTEGIDPSAAIRGLHGVTLLVRSSERSVSFLTEVLGLEVQDRFEARTRIRTGMGGPGSYLDVLESAHAPDAVNGLGTVHHVAMAVSGDEDQRLIRGELIRLGYSVTDVRDRQYFRSIYFHEPGGVLYEIATEGPGFTIDEKIEALGADLKLPSWKEANRAAIEEALPPIDED